MIDILISIFIVVVSAIIIQYLTKKYKAKITVKLFGHGSGRELVIKNTGSVPIKNISIEVLEGIDWFPGGGELPTEIDDLEPDEEYPWRVFHSTDSSLILKLKIYYKDYRKRTIEKIISR